MGHICREASQRQQTMSNEHCPLDVKDFALLARELFDAADTDQSRRIELPELQALLQWIVEQLGWTLTSSQMEFQVKKSLQEFDHSGGYGLTIDEFGALLCVEPWVQLLPAWKRAELEHAVRTVEQAALQARCREMSFSDFTAKISSLFGAVDTNGDGQLDCGELCDLLLLLSHAMGWSLSEEELVQEANKATIQFGVGGEIALVQFMAMVCTEPWCFLLPPDMQQQLKVAIDGVSTGFGDNSTIAELSRVSLRLFCAVDTDGDGTLDVGELTDLFMGLVGCTLPEAKSMTEEAVAVWAKDGTRVRFNEFVVMLCNEPWDRLLPSRLRKDLAVSAKIVEQVAMLAPEPSEHTDDPLQQQEGHPPNSPAGGSWAMAQRKPSISSIYNSHCQPGMHAFVAESLAPPTTVEVDYSSPPWCTINHMDSSQEVVVSAPALFTTSSRQSSPNRPRPRH